MGVQQGTYISLPSEYLLSSPTSKREINLYLKGTHMVRQRKLYEDKSELTIGNDSEATNCIWLVIFK